MSEASTTHAVVRAEPDGYDTTKQKLMGRHAAGNGFLRAAVAARGDQPIRGLAPEAAARGFSNLVRSIDPAARVEWIRPDQLSRVSQTGVLYLTDATVSWHSRQRQRVGVGAFSLCGVTHTTASEGVMNELKGLLREPVMPWDALVCTSSSVVETVHRVLEAEADYLRWRMGPGVAVEPPQLPIIPLGVHCDDFQISPQQRQAAREALNLSPETVTSLFVGRLVFHAKAHPFPMYAGLQAAAKRTGKPVALIMCGWAPNDAVQRAFENGARQFAPDVRTIFLDGRDATNRAHAWGAADMFVSLSDNIQETFGLTPIEAMAAGLPLVVTDWNGYRDTVRDGVEALRVKTWAPAPGMGAPLAGGYENTSMDYNRYCWGASSTTALDMRKLEDALCAVVESPDLRRRLGEAGRRRAREVYDWSVVYRQYQELWADLNARRRHAMADPAVRARIDAAPRESSSGLDPYYAFGHYPTAHIDAATVLRLAPDATADGLKAILDHPLFSELIMSRTSLEALFALVQAGDLTIEAAATHFKGALPPIARAAGFLAKAGVVVLS